MNNICITAEPIESIAVIQQCAVWQNLLFLVIFTLYLKTLSAGTYSKGTETKSYRYEIFVQSNIIFKEKRFHKN